MIKVTTIEGAAIDTAELESFSIEAVAKYLDVDLEDINKACAARKRNKNEQDATDITLSATDVHEVITYFDSDGEATFFIAEKGSYNRGL